MDIYSLLSLKVGLFIPQYQYFLLQQVSLKNLISLQLYYLFHPIAMYLVLTYTGLFLPFWIIFYLFMAINIFAQDYVSLYNQ